MSNSEPFEVGDRVVYNPNIPGLAPNTDPARAGDIGTVSAVTKDYVTITFDNGFQNNISRFFPGDVTHYSQSNKGEAYYS